MQLEKKGGKMICMFVDLKAASNSVDKVILVETMEERSIKKVLIKRVIKGNKMQSKGKKKQEKIS